MQSSQYTWRTVQDSKVRSSHAARAGKVFAWNDPPEGGHPGEEYNCRCWAEEVDNDANDKKKKCKDIAHRIQNEQLALERIRKKIAPIDQRYTWHAGRASALRDQVNAIGQHYGIKGLAIIMLRGGVVSFVFNLADAVKEAQPFYDEMIREEKAAQKALNDRKPRDNDREYYRERLRGFYKQRDDLGC